MAVNVVQESKHARFVIDGEINQTVAQELKDKFNSLPLSSIEEVIFDFKGVTHIGSAGIGKFLLFYKNASLSGGKISIQNVSESIYDLLKILKLDSLFTITKG